MPILPYTLLKALFFHPAVLEPVVSTTILPISTMSPLSPEPSTTLPIITSPSISTTPTTPTSYPSLLSPITSYAPLALPALPDPAAQSTAETEGDLHAPSDFSSATTFPDWQVLHYIHTVPCCSPPESL